MNYPRKEPFLTELILKRDKGSVPAFAGRSHLTPPGNAGRDCYSSFKGFSKQFGGVTLIPSWTFFTSKRFFLRATRTFQEMEEFMSKTKNVTKTGISISPELLARCDASIALTNAQSRSEFICDAIEFYIAALQSGGYSKVLTPALESVIGSKIALSEDRISRMVYKLAVEIAMLNHLYAAAYDTEEDYIEWLRDHCKLEVAKINGRMNLNDIAKEYVG